MNIKTVLVEGKTCEAFAGLYDGDLNAISQKNMLAIGALVQDEEQGYVPVGLIVFEDIEKTISIKWIYVHSAFRNKGVGLKLMDTVAGWAKGEGYEGIYTYYSDSEVGIFLNLLGFRTDKSQAKEYYSNIGGIVGLPKTEKSENMFRLKELPDMVLNRFNHVNQLSDTKIYVELPISPDDYMLESAVVLEHDEVVALVLLKEMTNTIYISYVYVKPGNEVKLIKLISKIKEDLLVKYPETKRISIAAINEQSVRLSHKLFPKAYVNNVYEAYLVL